MSTHLIIKKLIKHFLNHLEKWLITSFTGVFLFVVLYLFKAYDIQQGASASGNSLFLRAVTFGLATSFTFALHEFYLSRFFQFSHLYQKLLWHWWEVLVGANITFLIFNYFWNWTEWYWDSYLLLLGEYHLVMLFPLSFAIVFAIKQQKPTINNQEMLVFESENAKHQVKVKIESLLYIKSEDNYVKIVYCSSDKLKCELQRNSLKSIENNYPSHPNLIRCHRSYIVNPQHINQVVVQSRQVQLDLGFQEIIPVSKTYQDQFM